MRHAFIVFLAVCALGFPSRARPAQAQEVQPYGYDTWFDSDPKPQKAAVIGNPLDYAGRRIGIDPRNFPLTRATENSYRLACRFPVIDEVSNQPLYMKQWAEDSSERLIGAFRARGPAAVRDGLALLRGMEEGSWPLRAEAAAEAAEAEKALAAAPFTPKYRQALAGLLRGFLAARALAAKGRTNLSPEDLAFLDANPGFYLLPDGKTMPDITGPIETHFRFIGVARKIGFEHLFRASLVLSEAVREYAAAAAGWGKPEDYFADPKRAAETVRIETPDGALIVSGFGNDAHDQDGLFVVDLGGDDVWSNNAGGCSKCADGAALAVDHRGNDRYSAPKRNYVQGFGFLGAGILADLGGDDVYEAYHFSQGAAVLGVGCLWDAGGDDRYVAQAFVQGAGMFGLGMLLEGAGEDFYDAATSAQGSACTLGIGALCDLEGDDRYHLNVGAGKDILGNIAGYGQGGAISWRGNPWRGKLTAYGGAGMLVDASGNDRYRANTWNSQGGSYVMSLGVLYDREGNDHYTCGTGQGSGIHVTCAILVDRAGDDVYEAGFRGGGSGGDCSPGFLIDYKGDDVYRSSTSSFGTGCKPFCYSLFIDYEGRDAYVCSEPKGRIWMNNWDSFGGVWPESDPGMWPSAICLDLGGKDDYRVRNRENDSERQSFGHGIHLDTEWTGGDVIGPVRSPLEPYRELPLPPAALAHPAAADLVLLQSPDAFVRFQAVGRIAAMPADVVPVLALALQECGHRAYNRDLLECLHHFFAEGRITAKEIPSLLPLLKARDEEVRTILADDFGIWKTPEAEAALIDAARTDPAASVRRFAFRSLVVLSSAKALPLARELAAKDPDENVRRSAASLLGVAKDAEDSVPLLIRLLEADPSPPVRVAAANSLAILNDARALEPFRAAARSPDAYLRRAAGKGLANLGEIEGIAVLIRSLTFPSIDAFWNYNYNVPNFIAAYAGHDLPDPERYEQAAWEKWLEANRDKIDVKANAAAYREYATFQRTVQGAKPAEQVAAFEEFLKRFPKHEATCKDFASRLNGWAWEMVTAPANSAARDPATGLRYALRAVELDPAPPILDTLAEAYEANGQRDKALELCRETLKKHPGDKMFLDRVAKLEKAGSGR